jgi:uncharacterized protein
MNENTASITTEIGPAGERTSPPFPEFEPLLAPVSESARINSVDVIRGVAVLGILLMNIVSMGLPFEAYFDPTVAGGATGWNLQAWLIASLCFEGSMRAIFSMLFGASVLLFTCKGDEKAGVSVADAYYRRTIWLFIFGIIHGYVLLWPGDILYSYGLMGLFLFPFRRVAPGKLFALGLALLMVGAGTYLAENIKMVNLHARAAAAEQALEQGSGLTRELQAGLDQWNEKVQELKPSEEDIAEMIANVRGGYLSAAKQLAEYTYHYQSNIHYRYDYFDVLSMMFIGMALLKWGVLSAGLSARIYVGMAAAGYALGLLVNWREASIIMGQEFSVLSFYQAGLTYDVGRAAMMTGHIGVVMLLCRSCVAQWLTARLAAVGRMALTNYIFHTVVATAVFVGFKQYGQWERYQLYYLVFVIWTFQLIVSPLWLRHFQFGPLEWVWRALTYQRRQPFWRNGHL